MDEDSFGGEEGFEAEEDAATGAGIRLVAFAVVGSSEGAKNGKKGKARKRSP